MYAYVYISACVYMCACIDLRACVYMYILTWTLFACMHICVCTCDMCVHLCIYLCVCMCVILFSLESTWTFGLARVMSGPDPAPPGCSSAPPPPPCGSLLGCVSLSLLPHSGHSGVGCPTAMLGLSLLPNALGPAGYFFCSPCFLSL